MYELQIAYKLFDAATDQEAKVLLNMKSSGPMDESRTFRELPIAVKHGDYFLASGQQHLDERSRLYVDLLVEGFFYVSIKKKILAKEPKVSNRVSFLHADPEPTTRLIAKSVTR